MVARKHSGATRHRVSSNRVRTHPKRSRDSATQTLSRVPLVEVADALYNIGCAAHVAAAALANQSNEILSVRAGQVLIEHVVVPLAMNAEIVEAHAKVRPAVCLEHLLKARKRRARKGKRKPVR